VRILVTTDIFPPDAGGPATSVPLLAAALQQRRHAVTVLTWGARPHEPGDERYAFALERVPRPARLGGRLVRLLPRLVAHVRRADVVYVNGLLFPAYLAAALVPRPAVIKIVGDLAWEYARGRGLTDADIDDFQTVGSVRTVAWRRRLRRRALRAAHAVVVPSRYLAGLVEGWGVASHLVHVVPNAWSGDARSAESAAAGVARERDSAAARMRNTGVAASLPEVVTVCRLVPWKAVDGVIDAVAALPGVRLAVVGDGPERAALGAHACARGVADRVTFHGTVPPDEVQRRLAAGAVFVLNSRYEGFPHVVLEAFAAGVPVVAAAAGGTPEVVRDGVTGLLVPPRDAGALREAVRSVLTDADLRNKLVTGGREALGRYTVEATAQATEAVLVTARGAATRAVTG
jgi:glycosyltransferase involved in cell wall biosynthesis